MKSLVLLAAVIMAGTTVSQATEKSLFVPAFFMKACSVMATANSPDDIKDRTEMSRAALCVGYIAGVADMEQLNHVSANSAYLQKLSFCIPPNINPGTVTVDAARYISARPEFGSKMPYVAIYEALHALYPCR